MRRRIRTFVAVLGLVLSLAAGLAPSAAASGQWSGDDAFDFAYLYHLNVPSKGEVEIDSAVEILYSSTDFPIYVRTRGKIARRVPGSTPAVAVEVRKVELVSSTGKVRSVNAKAANSGHTNTSVTSYTPWVKILNGNGCPRWRVRATYAVRWKDGSLSVFTRMSPTYLSVRRMCL